MSKIKEILTWELENFEVNRIIEGKPISFRLGEGKSLKIIWDKGKNYAN